MVRMAKDMRLMGMFYGFRACVGSFHYWKVGLNFPGLLFHSGDAKYSKFATSKPKMNLKF